MALSPKLAAPHNRLAWIDWMRGLACILMFQTHCYDAWLGGEARNTGFLKTSQLLGTLPAPLFLFLAGISFALITGKLIGKNLSAAEIGRKLAYRGAEVLAFGFLFRLQEFVIAWGWAPWSDVLRVDILNIIGLSMILMALVCWLTLSVWKRFSAPPLDRSEPTPWLGAPPDAQQTPKKKPGFRPQDLSLVGTALIAAAVIAILTPPLYTTWRPTWLPWPIESYIDGCHNLGAPQPWLFSLFPWSAFAFAGLAAGFILFSETARTRTTHTLALLAVIGAAAVAVAYGLDHSPIRWYAVYDYWHTSPNFLMMRVGLLLVIAFLAYAWCQWGLATRGFSPFLQLGQTSLLVYWVHIELVYGKFSLLPKREESISAASRGFIEITLLMIILSMLRTRIDWKTMAISLRARMKTHTAAAS